MRSDDPRTSSQPPAQLAQELTPTARLCLADENPDDLDRLIAELIAELGARGMLDAFMARRLAIAIWQLARVDRMTAQVQAVIIGIDAPDRRLQVLDRYRRRLSQLLKPLTRQLGVTESELLARIGRRPSKVRLVSELPPAEQEALAREVRAIRRWH